MEDKSPSPRDPEVLVHYAGCLRTRRAYRVDIEAYQNDIGISRSFKYNKNFFEREAQRLDVFWSFSKWGRIITVKMRLHPDERVHSTYLKLIDYKELFPFWTDAIAEYQELPYVAGTISSSIHTTKIEDRYAALVNFGHALARTATRHINNKKSERLKELSPPSKNLDQILQEDKMFTILGTVGSLSASIPHTKGNLVTLHYS